MTTTTTETTTIPVKLAGFHEGKVATLVVSLTGNEYRPVSISVDGGDHAVAKLSRLDAATLFATLEAFIFRADIYSPSRVRADTVVIRNCAMTDGKPALFVKSATGESDFVELNARVANELIRLLDPHRR